MLQLQVERINAHALAMLMLMILAAAVFCAVVAANVFVVREMRRMSLEQRMASDAETTRESRLW